MLNCEYSDFVADIQKNFQDQKQSFGALKSCVFDKYI